MALKRLLILLPLLLCISCGQAADHENRELEPVRTAYLQGFYVEANTGYERYLQLYPQGQFRLEAWDRLLEIALNVQGDLDRAIILIEAMILEFDQSNESTWDLMFQLGDLYERNGKPDKALEAWENCLDMLEVEDSEREVETLLRMASAYRSNREFDLALKLLENCIKNAVDDETRARCRYEEAQTYSFMQSLGQAKEVLEVIVHSEEASPEIHAMTVFLLADVYEQEMDFDRARELFESIKDMYPNPMVIEVRLQNLGKGYNKK